MEQDKQFELIMTLNDTIKYLRDENTELHIRIQELNQTVANLTESVDYLTRKLYGKSRERLDDPNQLNMFDEAETEANPDEPEPSKEQVIDSYTRKKKPKSTRENIYGDLPVEEIPCKLSDEDKVCPLCGTELVLTGKRFVREELQLIPAKVKLIRYYQEVYSCPKCKKEDDEFVTVAAETPSPLFKHSLASPSTVAWVMYQKYALAMPLYRQEQDWLQHGVRLTRATLANWVIRSSLEYLKPVYNRLHEHLLDRDIIHADEVPCQVLKEPGREAKTKSYMWIYLTGNDDKAGIVLYDYKPGRKGQYAQEFLKGFKGYVHCDGYSGYNAPEDIERVGCYAHLRRKFFEAIPVRKVGSQKPAAEVGVQFCDRLFDLEREYKNLTAEERKQKRLEKENPILDEFYNWISTLNPTGGSKLDKAVTYAQNQRVSLENYFKDGRLELSNSAAERKAKSYVIGRKNFLFHDTVAGAEASAIVYSLVETAKANNLDIYQYLYRLLLFMPDYKNEPDGIEDLMPWSEFMQVSCPKVNQPSKEIGLKK